MTPDKSRNRTSAFWPKSTLPITAFIRTCENLISLTVRSTFPSKFRNHASQFSQCFRVLWVESNQWVQLVASLSIDFEACVSFRGIDEIVPFLWVQTISIEVSLDYSCH